MEFWFFFALIVAGLGLLPSVFFKDKENIFAVCLLCLLIFISGFRYQIGWDYYQYEIFFYMPADVLEEYVESSFVFLIAFMKEFGFSAQMMFFFYAVATLLFIYSAVKYYTDRPALFMAIYALIPYLFWNSMGAIRNYLAIAIVFWGSRFLVEKRLFLYMIAIALATSVHMSASIFFVLAFFLKQRYSLKIHFFLALVCFALSISEMSFSLMNWLLTWLGSKYAAYLLSALSTSLGLENILVSTTLWLTAIYLLRKEYQKPQGDPKAIVIANMATFSFAAMEFFYFSYELERIRDYGFPFLVVALILVLDRCIGERFREAASSLCLAFMVVLFLMFVNIYGNNIDGRTSMSLSAGNIHYEFNFALLEK